MRKELYILRSVPGAGKSTLAKSLISGIENSVICEADSFLYENGEYIWTPDRAYMAHKKCQSLFKESLEKNVERIVVSNTNVYLADVKLYKELAEQYGYTVFVLIVENRHGGTDSHDVSDEIKDKMENAIKSNIQLR